jgi:hypothetical protein
MRRTVEDCAKSTGLPIKVVMDITELESYKNASADIQRRMRGCKALFNPATGETVINLSAHSDVEDVMESLRHEIIGHKNLRDMLGNERMNIFLDWAYRHMTEELRGRVLDIARKSGIGIREATEEYFARLAEKPFEAMNAVERTIWQKVKDFLTRMLNKFMRTLHLPEWVTLSDRECRWILRFGWEMNESNPINRRTDLPDVVKTARVETLRAETGMGSSDRAPLFRPAIDPNEDLQSIITRSALEMSAKHRDNVDMRNDAYAAVSQQLNGLRRAMAVQRRFDRSTVQEMTDLTQSLLQAGMLSSATDGEIKRILSAVKNATGRTDIKDQVHTVLSILIDNQLRQQKNTFDQLLSIRDTKINQQGVRAQGALDINGQRMIKALRDALEIDESSLADKLEEATNAMGDTDAVKREQAAIDYEALTYAQRYQEVYKKSRADELALRAELKQAEADHKAGDMTDEAYRQFCESVNEQLEQNMLERADGLRQLSYDLGQSLAGSRTAAREWKEREVERVNNIHHMANADLQGLPFDEHRTPDFLEKVVNSAPVKFLTSTLPTFDAFLRLFSPHSAGGEGYMYDHYMRSYVTSCENERKGLNATMKLLDKKAEEIFGKGMTWRKAAIAARQMKLANGKTEHTLSFWSGGGMKDFKVTSSELTYLYMVNKMLDGKMKLRRMGIEDEHIAAIKQALDPRLVELADWLQEEFFPQTRERYNEVHKRMFGAGMSAIDNYVPLKILKESLERNVDVGAPDKNDQRSATVTGSVISRTVNCQPIDVLHGDVFNIVTSHVTDMEHWAAFSEFARDINTLVSYNRFRNKVRNMHSAFGAGNELLKKFETTCAIVTGNYHSPVSGTLDQAAVNLAKLGSTAKVGFRLYTAFKQLSSMPAFFPETTPVDFFKSAVTPGSSWNWCMENLPMFEKRWAGRAAGNEKLLPTDLDWDWTRSNVVEKLTQWGLTPNAFVDALTVAIGSKAVYDTHLKRYLRYGFGQEEAERRARQDASIIFNKTQQSSEGAFMSEMQKQRSWLSTSLTVYRNSPISYERMLVEANRNLVKRLQPGFKEESIAYMQKKFVWEGLDEEQAERAARHEYYRTAWRDIANIATFGYAMQLAWNVFGKLPGLLLPQLFSGTDEDDRKKTLQEENIHALIGGQVEGLTGGDIISDGLTSIVTGGSITDLTKDMPVTQDIDNIVREFGYDRYAALNDLLNTLASVTTGANPATFSDAAVAIFDACQGDMPTIREVTFCLARIAQVPQSQLSQIYFEELGCMGDEAKTLTPQQVAERYARYKVMKGAPLMHWFYSDEVRDQRKASYEEQATTKLKEQLLRLYPQEVNDAYDQAEEIYKDVSVRVKEGRDKFEEATTDEQREALSRSYAAMTGEDDFRIYRIFKLYNKHLSDLSKKYMEAKTPAEATHYLEGLRYFKPKMMEIINAADEAESNRKAEELSRWYSTFLMEQPKP